MKRERRLKRAYEGLAADEREFNQSKTMMAMTTCYQVAVATYARACWNRLEAWPVSKLELRLDGRRNQMQSDPASSSEFQWVPVSSSEFQWVPVSSSES